MSLTLGLRLLTDLTVILLPSLSECPGYISRIAAYLLSTLHCTRGINALSFLIQEVLTYHRDASHCALVVNASPFYIREIPTYHWMRLWRSDLAPRSPHGTHPWLFSSVAIALAFVWICSRCPGSQSYA
ncbi:hypothetical protein R1flu_027881 [Riccia fluitans]|uniref:Uncharacterized protein n=1 Tax=Riccia fluitans TaxID=41844 RepID=A0ABD1XK28_9MARC